MIAIPVPGTVRNAEMSHSSASGHPGDSRATCAASPRRSRLRALRSPGGPTRPRPGPRAGPPIPLVLGEHGLTLPPETEPLHPSRRAVQLDWRLRELEDLQAERRRLELLDRLWGTLTFGLWGR